MNSAEAAFGIPLVLVLLALAIYSSWRQRVVARSLPGIEDADTRVYLQRQIRRRSLCSAMLVVLALMIVGWWLIEGNLPENANAPRGNRAVAHIFVYYWGAFMLVLLLVLLLAALDLLANARFGFRQQRKLEAARHDMLEQEAARIRRERNS